MALRNILLDTDPLLRKKSRPITDFNPRLHTLLDDMRETLMDAQGAGLAAPQVGVLRRAVIVVDAERDDPEKEEKIIELINPEIIERDGEQCGPEGCLSVPGVFGMVTRPMRVKVRAQDRYGKFFEVEGEGITARAFCHEIDHLNGVIFTELVEKILTEEELDEYFSGGDDEEDENNIEE